MERAEKKQSFRTQQIQLRIKQKEERIRCIEEQRRQQLLQQKKKLQRELFTRQKILEAKVPQPSAEVVEKKLVSLLGPGAGAKVRVRSRKTFAASVIVHRWAVGPLGRCTGGMLAAVSL